MRVYGFGRSIVECPSCHLLIQCLCALVMEYMCPEFGISYLNFHKLGGSHVYEESPLCHVHFCIAKRQLHQWNVPTHHGRQCAKFEPCVTRGLTCSLKRMKKGANDVHVPSTCTMHRAQHVQCVPQITFYLSS